MPISCLASALNVKRSLREGKRRVEKDLGEIYLPSSVRIKASQRAPHPAPYWFLLGQKIHYLDFYKYVEKLHCLLSEFAHDSSPAFLPDFVPLHNEHFNIPDKDILLYLLDLSEEQRTEVKVILQELCIGLVIVTERQLADFLPEGRYHRVPGNNPLRGKMKHSHLTNLIGEQMFGDLDFSLFKRRSASLFHHSTINILKRKRSVSAWFLMKSNEEQAKLLNLSAKKAPEARKRSAEEERGAVAKRKVILDKQRLEKPRRNFFSPTVVLVLHLNM
ncbi:hypothetical protein LSH36_544g05064 [Paralvinella palmiformis]|uniref:Uncharacterized protein n=1 Tax=Paralvinella palmiformis TaxID=53620 RepID=A0AAD9J8E4_9ANNE|nr:hypothetical protein LSH36_544g05064 [Paralvinella palmiformis]